MPFIGQLDRSAFTVELVGGTANVADTALTVAKIVKADKFTKVDTATAGVGLTEAIEVKIGKTEVRVVLSVYPPKGGTATIRIIQGARQLEEAVGGDTTLVWDIKPV